MPASHRAASASGYLLHDLFTDAQSAPITTPRICKPGPGTLTMIQTSTGTGNTISGGKYLRPRPSGSQSFAGDGCYSPQPFARRPGLMAYSKCQSATIDRFYPVAWLSSAALAEPTSGGLKFSSTGELDVQDYGGTVAIGASLTANTDYQVAVIVSGSGFLYLIQGGTQFPTWTLAYVSIQAIDPLLYFGSPNFNADVKTSAFAVLQKGGPLAMDYGKCVAFSPILNSGDTFTGAADGLDYVTWTPETGETLSIYFRRTDDSNAYRLDCSQGGSTIKLYRTVTGADTELAAGKTQTWTVGIGYRIGIIHAAGEIRTFVQPVNAAPVAKHVVTGESFNLATTGLKIAGGALAANLEAWPRTFSGTNELDLA